MHSLDHNPEGQQAGSLTGDAQEKFPGQIYMCMLWILHTLWLVMGWLVLGCSVRRLYRGVWRPRQQPTILRTLQFLSLVAGLVLPPLTMAKTLTGLLGGETTTTGILLSLAQGWLLTCCSLLLTLLAVEELYSVAQVPLLISGILVLPIGPVAYLAVAHNHSCFLQHLPAGLTVICPKNMDWFDVSLLPLLAVTVGAFVTSGFAINFYGEFSGNQNRNRTMVSPECSSSPYLVFKEPTERRSECIGLTPFSLGASYHTPSSCSVIKNTDHPINGPQPAEISSLEECPFESLQDMNYKHHEPTTPNCSITSAPGSMYATHSRASVSSRSSRNTSACGQTVFHPMLPVIFESQRIHSPGQDSEQQRPVLSVNNGFVQRNLGDYGRTSIAWPEHGSHADRLRSEEGGNSRETSHTSRKGIKVIKVSHITVLLTLSLLLTQMPVLLVKLLYIQIPYKVLVYALPLLSLLHITWFYLVSLLSPRAGSWSSLRVLRESVGSAHESIPNGQ